MEKINYGVGVIVSFTEFKEAWEAGEVKELKEGLRELQNSHQRVIDSYTYEVSLYIEDRFGGIFLALITSYSDYVEFCLWTPSGQDTIIYSEIRDEDDIKEIETAMDKYSTKGEFKCAGCDEWVTRRGVKESIFAGNYCLQNDKCRTIYKEDSKDITTH